MARPTPPKDWVERLLDAGARVCVVDPLGIWWGLRARADPQDLAGADSAAAGYPVVVFGGRHADVALDESMGAALGRLIGTGQLACVVDLSELGSSAARRRFMAAFVEAVYDPNTEPLHLVLDEADLWAPQRPQPDAYLLLGRIEEIVLHLPDTVAAAALGRLLTVARGNTGQSDTVANFLLA